MNKCVVVVVVVGKSSEGAVLSLVITLLICFA
jgi:hypothetical protein